MFTASETAGWEPSLPPQLWVARAAHKTLFICEKVKSVMQHTARPGKSSMYGGRNPPCSPACALLVDLITLPAQAGDTELQAWSQLFSSQPQLDTQASVSEVVGCHQPHTLVVHHVLDGVCLFVS